MQTLLRLLLVAATLAVVAFTMGAARAQQPKFNLDSFFGADKQPPPVVTSSPTVTRIKKKAAEKVAKPAPQTEPVVESKSNDITEQSNLYVALFTVTNRLFWTGQVNGKVAVHASTRSRMEFAAECVTAEKAETCTKWVLREAKPSEAAGGYYSFRVGDRVVIWPHTAIFSATPFAFPEKPLVEKL